MTQRELQKARKAMQQLFNAWNNFSMCLSDVDKALLSGMIAGKQTNLDNGISQAVIQASAEEGTDMSKYRTALNINGEKCWISANSLQEFVDDAMAKCQSPSAASERQFEAYAWEWMETWKKPKLKLTTYDNYACDLRKHVLPVIGNMNISTIREADIQHVYTALIDANLSKSKSHEVQAVMHQIFDAAIHDGLYARVNPVEDKRLTQPDKKQERPPLTDAEIRNALMALDNLPSELSSILALAIMTGGRRSEVLGIRWEDIDEENGVLHLEQVNRIVRGRATISNVMKSQKAHRIATFVPVLKKYLGEPQQSGLIVNKNGNPLSEKEYNTRWNKIAKYINPNRRVTMHQLRHTYTSICAASGEITPKTLQAILGHADISTTMNIYASVRQSEVTKAGQIVGKALEQMKATKAKTARFTA